MTSAEQREKTPRGQQLVMLDRRSRLGKQITDLGETFDLSVVFQTPPDNRPLLERWQTVYFRTASGNIYQIINLPDKNKSLVGNRDAAREKGGSVGHIYGDEETRQELAGLSLQVGSSFIFPGHFNTTAVREIVPATEKLAGEDLDFAEIAAEGRINTIADELHSFIPLD